MRAFLFGLVFATVSEAFQSVVPKRTTCFPDNTVLHMADDSSMTANRRDFLVQVMTTSTAIVAAAATSASLPPQPAQAIGPVRLSLTPTSYIAKTCPPNKPIPGEKAMKGMRGLCVTVQATLDDPSPKDLDKVGVYGFITDGDTGDSVLANNPDLSTDAGQFAIVQKVLTTDKTIEFEFIAAVPVEKDLSQYENGIGPLKFESLRLVSFPGGQQYGEINPCEMNEFSTECEEWEEENGPYKKGKFMMESNSRTKGR